MSSAASNGPGTPSGEQRGGLPHEDLVAESRLAGAWPPGTIVGTRRRGCPQGLETQAQETRPMFASTIAAMLLIAQAPPSVKEHAITVEVRDLHSDAAVPDVSIK